MTKTVILALTQDGATLANKIKDIVDNGEVHGLSARVDAANAAQLFDNTIEHIQGLFKEGASIIGICASAILIRAVAPLLGDKRSEPPVISIGQDASSVVPLLGGHHGANKMAREIADALKSHAAITTASDLCMGFSLDQPPAGYVLENPEMMKPITAALLAGEPVRLVHEAGDEAWPPAKRFSETDGDYTVLVTDLADCADNKTLVIHPATLTIGVGCERNAPAGDLTEFVRANLSDAGLSEQSIAAIGSIDIKVDEPAIKALAADFNKPFRVMSAATLEAEAPRLKNPSDVVFSETGCHGVAEGSALSLAGPEAELLLEKKKDAKHTVAIARAPKINVENIGRIPGRLFLVGIGPGNVEWRTKEAVDALQEADEIVGYQLYLDLVADLIEGKNTHNSELGEEEARARRAIELAAEGKVVALVCSGDPGIYALATLAFELIDRADDRAWSGIEVITCPGVSAFQAAAARIGAPVNHDFCTISLSDLLTPREAILKRLKAAGEGDFVISFYNPQSMRRRTLLGEARTILLDHRPKTTPVLIARNLGREDETITVTTLVDFDPEMVDMLSLVMVGNSETKAVVRGGRTIVYTPRGYAKKMSD